MRAPRTEPLTDFASLTAPTGGDQIALRHFANGAWEDAIAITPAGGDLYRPASAVEHGRASRPVQISKAPGSDVFPVAATDSKGQVWVAWQAWHRGRSAILVAIQKGGSFTAPAVIS